MQDAKCKMNSECEMDAAQTPRSRVDDNCSEDSRDLSAFVPKPLDLGLRLKLKRDTDAQPVGTFPRLSEGDVNVTNEFAP